MSQSTHPHRVLLAWSGGLDSTALLLRCLNAGYHVTAVSCEFENVRDAKLSREAAARSSILEYIKQRFGQQAFTHRAGKLSYADAPMELMGFQQAVPWLQLLFANVERQHGAVYLGYVQGDDIIGWLDELRGIWKAFAQLGTGQLPELQFPLYRESKTTLWQELVAAGLHEHVTWCESDQTTARCGQCLPCKKMIMYGLQKSPEAVELENMRRVSNSHSDMPKSQIVLGESGVSTSEEPHGYSVIKHSDPRSRHHMLNASRSAVIIWEKPSDELAEELRGLSTKPCVVLKSKQQTCGGCVVKTTGLEAFVIGRNSSRPIATAHLVEDIADENPLNDLGDALFDFFSQIGVVVYERNIAPFDEWKEPIIGVEILENIGVEDVEEFNSGRWFKLHSRDAAEKPKHDALRMIDDLRLAISSLRWQGRLDNRVQLKIVDRDTLNGSAPPGRFNFIEFTSAKSNQQLLFPFPKSFEAQTIRQIASLAVRSFAPHVVIAGEPPLTAAQADALERLYFSTASV